MLHCDEEVLHCDEEQPLFVYAATLVSLEKPLHRRTKPLFQEETRLDARKQPLLQEGMSLVPKKVTLFLGNQRRSSNELPLSPWRCERVTDSPSFPNPIPPLASVTAAINEL
jgi:hypothetical protein